MAYCVCALRVMHALNLLYIGVCIFAFGFRVAA